MPQVLVWKCPHTGRLFEDEKKYRTHLSGIARQYREQRKIQIAENAAQAWWTEVQNREMDIKDLPEFIIENQSRFWAEAAKANPGDWDQIGKKRNGIVMPVPELVEFTKFDLGWSNSVSNTHCCPKDGVTNWGGQTKLEDGTPAPRGYPGWCGRIEWIIKWPKQWDGCYPGSDLFKGRRACIHTGTGGGGGYKNGNQSFGYHVEIFAADWPGLARYWEKHLAWKILGAGPDRIRSN